MRIRQEKRGSFSANETLGFLEEIWDQQLARAEAGIDAGRFVLLQEPFTRLYKIPRADQFSIDSATISRTPELRLPKPQRRSAGMRPLPSTHEVRNLPQKLQNPRISGGFGVCAILGSNQ